MVEKNNSETLDKAFNDANNFIKTYKDPKVKLSNDEKLKFYALFKQSTTGECTGSQPSKLNVIARAKYDAWKALGNISKDEAKNKFIELLKSRIPAYQPKL